MKIVAKKPIKMKIDAHIDNLKRQCVEILRIELSSSEFNEFFKNLKENPYIEEQDIEMDNCYFEAAVFGSYTVKSGSYIVYRDVCVQHHKDYPHGDIGVEYI